MLLEQYNNDKLLFNSNFLEKTDDGSHWAYRGELILVEGEIGDDKGHAKPPKEVLRGAAILADEKIKLLIGALDDIDVLPALIEKYQQAFSSDLQAMIFIVNLKDPVKVTIANTTFTLIPLLQGVPWNETMEELAIEKSDLKGISAANKLIAIWQELKAYKSKYPLVELEQALDMKTGAIREGWGAV